MPKKRGHGDGALYFVPSQGLWRGVVDVGFWPDGRRRQRSVSSKSKIAAKAKLDSLKGEIAQHGQPLDKTTTVEAWSRHWLDTICRPTLKPHTLATYTSLVQTWIVPTLGKKKLSLLRPSDLRAVSQAVTAAGRSSSTALKTHNVLSAMLEAARLDGMTPRNVARDVVAPRAAISDRGALTTEQALAVLSAALKEPDGARWWFAILTGMRQGERSGATLDSIQGDQFVVQWSLTEARFEHGCGGACAHKRAGSCPQRRLILADGLEYRHLDGRLILVRPKSGKPRSFPLIPQLARLLKDTDTPNPHNLIWRNPDGSPITAAQDSAAWRAILLKAGVITPDQALEPKDRPEGTPVTPTTHWARHTTATVLMELGVDARIVGEIVGHATTRVTARYQHVSSHAALEAMQAIGRHFNLSDTSGTA